MLWLKKLWYFMSGGASRDLKRAGTLLQENERFWKTANADYAALTLRVDYSALNHLHGKQFWAYSAATRLLFTRVQAALNVIGQNHKKIYELHNRFDRGYY